MKKIIYSTFIVLVFVLIFLSAAEFFGLREKFINFYSENKEQIQTENGKDISKNKSKADKENTESMDYADRMEKGNYFLGKGFLSLAANEFTVAAKLNPKNIDPLWKLSNLHFLLGDYNKSKKSLEIVIELNPSHTDAYILYGRVFIKQNNFDEAQKYFKNIPNKTKLAHFYIALLEIIHDNHENAKTALVEAKAAGKNKTVDENINKFLNSYSEFELFTGEQTLYLDALFAKNLNQIKEFEMAVHKLRNILKQKADYRDSWILLGYAYLNLERYEFALTAFDKAYTLDPEKAEVQYFLGITYFELKKYKESISYLEVALKNGFEPHIQIKQKLGDIYLIIEDYEKSVAAYEDVLKLNDSDINSYIKPIWIYLDFLNRPDRALELALKAQKKHSKNAMSYNLIGWSYLGKKEYTKAEEFFQKAMAIDKKLPAVYFNLGKLYQAKKENEKAKKFYKYAYNLDKDGNIGILAAQFYNQLVSK